MNRSHEDPAGLTGEPLHAALLAYARYPGKYPAGLRQPPALFASVREIVQLAIGRGASGASIDDPEGVAIHEAACFFVKTAMLYPGADHYALLGLDRTADNAALKDRYRLLMRLIHPDFSGAGSAHWPAEAAVRVNMAYEVLSSAVRRRDYDVSLRRAPDQPARQRISAPLRPRAQGLSRAGYGRLIAACGVAGALVLINLLMSGREGVQLVQRETPTARPAVVVAQQTIATPAPTVVAAPVQRVQPPQPTAPLPVAEQARPIPAPPAPRVTTPPAPVPGPVLALAPAHAPAPVAPVARPLPQPLLAAVPARVEPPAPIPAPVVVPVQVARAAPPPVTSAPAPAASLPTAPVVALSAATPALPVRPARPASVPGLSLAEIQPLLAVLLQQLESGRGDRLLNMLDREARNQPGPQALSRFYDNFTEGMRPVRLSHVEFKAEPADGRLLVIGNIGLQLGEPAGSVNKKMMLRAEFSSRDGGVVMTGLSGGHGY